MTHDQTQALNHFPSTSAKGKKGEDRASEFLQNLGYHIIERNFRTRGGEIDIIAEKDDVLVFCEVKYLPHGDPEMLAHVLNQNKRQKIIKTAKCYLEKYRQYNCRIIRFDVLAIDVPGLEPVHHIVNAFSE
ncbi:MAG: YraN family protein [Treponema sp.]|jgi:putative endonuclease|nr:YraN family protein [Treponema sp.]MEE3314569.1 YraN family protein [Treponema sp.]